MTETEPEPFRPPWSDEEYDYVLRLMVTEDAPEVFAVVEEYGQRLDASIAAWGLAFEDRAEVFGRNGGLRMSLGSPDRAAALFGCREGVTARLMWPYREMEVG